MNPHLNLVFIAARGRVVRTLPPSRRFGFLVTVLAALLGACLLSSAARAAAPITDLPGEYDLAADVQSKTGSGMVRLNFGVQANGAGYHLVIGPREMVLSKHSAAGDSRLASSTAGGLDDTKVVPIKFSIQRRSGRIFVLEGSQLRMSVEDASYSGGAASDSAAGAECRDLRVQPIETLYFSDDFMRQPTEQGEWNYDTGYWRIQTIGIVQRGANPFSLESRPDPVAVASAGFPFWTDYSFQAAAKGSANTSFGICVDLQSPESFYLLRWSAGADGALTLEKVVAGHATVLASRKGGFIPDLWYHLGLRTSGGQLVAEVDHQPVLSVQDTRFGAGKIALYSRGDNGHTVWFDSVLVRPAHLVYDDFSASSVHHWDDQDGKAVGGSPGWENYTTTAETTGVSEPVGIPIHYRDAADYYTFECGPESSSLVAVVKGHRQVLATAAHGAKPGESHRLQAGYEDGYLWGAVDGKKVVEGVDFSLRSGRSGFQPASLGGKAIHSVSVVVSDPPEPTDALTAEFQNVQHHVEMQAWAGPLNAWEPAAFGNEAGYWHKGNLFGDLEVKVPLIPKDLQDGTFAVLLNGDGQTAHSGYELDYTAHGAAGISLALLRRGQKVASGHLAPPSPDEDAVNLDVYRHGAFIYAGIGPRIALQFRDEAPLDGYSLPQSVGLAADRSGQSRLGLIIRGSTPLDIPDIVVSSRHVYAETFHLAPTNWRPQSGDWDVTRRWACQPGWTWYGGRSTGYAVNWYKSALLGDQSIDYYGAAMMAAVEDSTHEPNREAWRDLNCSFCSDGVNLFSGYTLIVDGWDSRTTRLFRNGHQVAESDAFHFPPASVAHRLWFDTHILKQGGRIQVVLTYVDAGGQELTYPLIDWTDPDPLKGGFVGFWTYDNGMMLARAVLSYQDLGKAPLYAAVPVWLAQEPDDAPYPKFPDIGAAAAPLIKPDTTALQPASPVVDIGALPHRSAAPRG